MASRSDSDTRSDTRSPANSVLNPLNKLIGGFTNMFTRGPKSDFGESENVTPAAGESESVTPSQGHQPSSSSSSPATRAERFSGASNADTIFPLSKRQQKRFHKNKEQLSVSQEQGTFSLGENLNPTTSSSKRKDKKRGGAGNNISADARRNLPPSPGAIVSAGPSVSKGHEKRFSAADARPPSSAGDAGDAFSVLSTLNQQPTPTEASFASPLSEEGDTALAEDILQNHNIIPSPERLPSSIASPATGVATLYVVGQPPHFGGSGRGSGSMTYSPTSLQDVAYAREFVPRGAAAALTEENIHDLQQTQGHQHLYAETMYARGEEEVLNGYEDSYTAEDVVFSPVIKTTTSQLPEQLLGTPHNKELPKQITPILTQVTPLQKMLTDFMLNSGAIANPSPALYRLPPQIVENDDSDNFVPPKRATTSSTGTTNPSIEALNAPLREPTASRKWFNPIIRDPRTGQVLDLPDKSQSTTPPNTGRGGEAWTGGKSQGLKGEFGDLVKSNMQGGDASSVGGGMRRSNSLTTLSKDLLGGNQGPGRRCLADLNDPDALEGPIRVARCELPQSQMRPVINTPVHPYLSLKDVRSNKHWEDKIICDEVDDLPKSKHVIYRWSRGPPIAPCIYHKHKTSTLRDTSKTYQFYCSKECLFRGWRSLPKELWLVPSKDIMSSQPQSPFEKEVTHPSGSPLYGGNPSGSQTVLHGGNPQGSYDWSSETVRLMSEWEIVAHTRTYMPSLDDINRPLRFEAIPLSQPLRLTKTKGREALDRESGPEESSCAESETSPKEGQRPLWHLGKAVTTGTVIPTPKEAITRRMLSYGGQFSAGWLHLQYKVLNYNILADIYCTESQYPYCEKFAISWNYRKWLIIKEIRSINADIVTLQEVQSDHFTEWIQPLLEESGYEGVYQQKKHKNPIFHKGKFTVEGCATFFKKSRFRLVEKHVIEFDEAARQRITSEEALQRLSKGNIALLLLLEDKNIQRPPGSEALKQYQDAYEEHNDPKVRPPPLGKNGGQLLCLVNTHILADPEYTDVKLWQAQLLLNTIETQLNDLEGCPLLVCGDFNSTPESAVYELWHDGHVSPTHDDLISRPDVAGLLSNPLQFGHNLKMMSAYEACSGTEAEYTNYTEDFKGTLDYIWFSPDSVSALAVSQVDEPSLLQQETALPSSTRPSDHISLVGTFMFVDPLSRALQAKGLMEGAKSNIALQQIEEMSKRHMENQAKYARLCEESYGYVACEDMWYGNGYGNNWDAGGWNQQSGPSKWNSSSNWWLSQGNSSQVVNEDADERQKRPWTIRDPLTGKRWNQSLNRGSGMVGFNESFNLNPEEDWRGEDFLDPMSGYYGGGNMYGGGDAYNAKDSEQEPFPEKDEHNFPSLSAAAGTIATPKTSTNVKMKDSEIDESGGVPPPPESSPEVSSFVSAAKGGSSSKSGALAPWAGIQQTNANRSSDSGDLTAESPALPANFPPPPPPPPINLPPLPMPAPNNSSLGSARTITGPPGAPPPELPAFPPPPTSSLPVHLWGKGAKKGNQLKGGGFIPGSWKGISSSDKGSPPEDGKGIQETTPRGGSSLSSTPYAAKGGKASNDLYASFNRSEDFGKGDPFGKGRADRRKGDASFPLSDVDQYEARPEPLQEGRHAAAYYREPNPPPALGNNDSEPRPTPTNLYSKFSTAGLQILGLMGERNRRDEEEDSAPPALDGYGSPPPDYGAERPGYAEAAPGSRKYYDEFPPAHSPNHGFAAYPRGAYEGYDDVPPPPEDD